MDNERRFNIISSKIRKKGVLKKTKNKENCYLPIVKSVPYNLGHLYKNIQASLNKTQCIALNPIKNKDSRAESLSSKQNTRSTQISMRAELSILRFQQKQLLLEQTQLQKRRQKKVYNTDKTEGEQVQFFKALKHQSSKQMKQDMNQQNYDQQFPMINLTNICYDSQFLYQREGAGLTILNNKLYLFGGAIRRKFCQLPEGLNNKNQDMLFHSYGDNRWEKEEVKGQVSPDHKNLIYHSICPINKKYLVIAGGMVGDTRKTLTKFNKSILLYSVETKKMQEFNWGVCLRSHTCVSFDNFMILHGGINEMSKYISEMHVINFSIGNMSLNPRVFKFQTNLELAHHQMVTTLGEDKSFRMNLRENNGIYIFGGENQNAEMDNNLKILKIYSCSQLQKKGVKKFQVLKTVGEAPCPRKNHSMNLVIKRYGLVIVGGVDGRSNFLSDVWLMNLLQLRWCRIETEPSIDMFYGGICKHLTASNNSSIFILGGHHLNEVGNENFWRLDIFTANKKSSRQKRGSDASKVTSLWSIRNNDNKFGTLDKILFND